MTCIREAVADEGHRDHDSPAAPAPPPPQRKGSVARLVDEASGVRGVTAELPLSNEGVPGPLLRLKSKPGEAVERMWVSVVGSTRQLGGAQCEGFSLVVNGARVVAPSPKRSTQGAAAALRAAYAASALTPLAQNNPTLGVKVCSSTFAVPEDELRTLQKFLAIRDELAQSPAPAASAGASAPSPASTASTAPSPAASGASPAPAASFPPSP